jgi:hypothetical protein
MMRHIEQLAVDAGFDKLYLSVGPHENPGACNLYLRLGYQSLQDEPYLGHWRFSDSDGFLHEGEEWMVDMVKVLGQSQSCRE